MMLAVVVFCLPFAAYSHSHRHLNHRWTNRELNSTLAKKIYEKQNKCTPTVNEYFHKSSGMGSDLHVWTQAVCNSMQTGETLLLKDESWIWNDKAFCQQHSTVKGPFGCYFNLQLTCPESKFSHRPIKVSNGYEMCPKYIKNIDDRQAFRAAAIEYLFSNLNEKLVKETNEAIVEVFGDTGIPKNLITLHLRWGDKGREMTLVTAQEYFDGIAALVANHSIASPHIYVTTESMDGIEQLKDVVRQNGKDWKVVYFAPAVFEEAKAFVPSSRAQQPASTDGGNVTAPKMISPMDMAIMTQGAVGKNSMVALLLAMEARYFLLTSGSNWSRLIDELRRSVVDVDCNGCTEMVDLREGIPTAQNWRARP